MTRQHMGDIDAQIEDYARAGHVTRGRGAVLVLLLEEKHALGLRYLTVHDIRAYAPILFGNADFVERLDSYDPATDYIVLEAIPIVGALCALTPRYRRYSVRLASAA